MTRTWGVAAALIVVASSTGCGPSAPPVGTSSNELTGAVTWTNIGYGINGATVGSGPDVLVVYGGYTATDADSEALSLQYVSAQMGALDVGHVYAVRGPEDADYSAREIGNSHLAAQLAAMGSSVGFVAIVAHSSGAFVADELFTEASAPVLSKIVYFDLDGGSWALNDTLVGEMKGVYFCNAHDPVAGESANYSAIVSLHADFPASHYYTVDSAGSGCDVGAVWCLHDTLITTRPHNPTTYDLDDDYTDFTGAGRHVVIAEMQQAIADGVLPGGATTVDAGAGPGNDAGNDAEPDGACLTDSGSAVPENTCTSTLQCDDGVWVDRYSDPTACL